MPKIVNHDAYREELLQRAFALFAQQGYGQVSMRQVAEALDVSTGTLYHYFPSKEALFQQIVALVVQRDVAELQARLAGLRSLEDKLAALAGQIVEEREELISVILLTVDYYRRQPGSSPQDPIRTALSGYIDALARLLGLPADLVGVLMAAVDGLLLQHYPAADPAGLKAGLDQLRRMALACQAAQEDSQ